MSRLRTMLAVVALCACSEPSDDEREAAEAIGLTDVRFVDNEWFGCGKDDSAWASHSFVATTARGKRVEGSVCCGLIFKSCTVRF